MHFTTAGVARKRLGSIQGLKRCQANITYYIVCQVFLFMLWVRGLPRAGPAPNCQLFAAAVLINASIRRRMAGPLSLPPEENSSSPM